MKTFTPDSRSGGSGRLREYAARFAPDFPQSKPARWAGVYLQGLLLDGERKSIEPLSHRVTLPPGSDHQRPRAGAPTVRQPEPLGRPEGADPLPRPDGRAVRLARRRVRPRRHQLPQAGSALRRGPAPVLRGVGQAGQLPGRRHPSLLRPAGALPAGPSPAPARELDRRHPADGCGRRARGVPGRQDQGRDRPGVDRSGARGRDQRRHGGRRPGLRGCRGAGRAGRTGIALRRRRAGHQRGVPERAELGSPAAHRRRGPAPGRWVLDPKSPPPVSVEAVAKGLALRRVSWRSGTKGKLSARFGWVRVWPGHEWKHGACADAEPLWLLVEARDDGQVQYALSNLPPTTSRLAAVRLWKQRWRVEPGAPADEGGAGPGPLRGPELARVPPPRGDGPVGLRVPVARTQAPPTRAHRRGKKGRPSHR